MTRIAGTDISLGTTLYSFTNEWVARRVGFRELLERVARGGIGPGVEVVGFQSIRSYPHITPEFERLWKDAVDELGIEPSALSSNIDVGLRSDRFLDVDEMTEYLSVQIAAAARLGFPVVRVQMGATPAVLENVLPLAEGLGITLGMEIHAPEGATTPAVLKVREFYDRIQSDRLGFVPDFSSTMRSIPPAFTRRSIAQGLSPRAVDDLQLEWATDGVPIERYRRWAARSEEAGEPAVAIKNAVGAFTMFGHEPLESWAEILPQTVHVHGKFYRVIDGEEPAIDYAGALRLLVEGGFRGYISSEWEGHMLTDIGEVDVVEEIRAHQELETRSALSALASLTGGEPRS